MKVIFLDTSGLYEYLDDVQPRHREVAGLLESSKPCRFVTSNFVRDELITLCLTRRGHDVARRVGNLLMQGGAMDVIHVTPSDEQQAWQLFLQRPDKRYSFTDCTSFVLMRRQGIRAALSMDDHFRQEGFELLP